MIMIMTELVDEWLLSASRSQINKKPKRLENSQLIRKTWHVNQIFELILEQWVANYYGDNTIVK